MRQTRSPFGTLIISVASLCVLTLMGAWALRRSPADQVETAAPPVPTVGVASRVPLEQNVAVRRVRASTKPADAEEEATPAASQKPRLDQPLELATAPHHKRLTPPIAERIVLDPSSPQFPSLPDLQPSLYSGGGHEKRARTAPPQLPEVTPPDAEVERHEARQVPDIVTCWPYPRQLIQLLTPLHEAPACGDWPARVKTALQQLQMLNALGGERAGGQLERLQGLAQEGQSMIEAMDATPHQEAMSRAVYALERRLAVWQAVHGVTQPRFAHASLRDGYAAELPAKLAAAEECLQEFHNAADWRQYLLLDELKAVTSERWAPSVQARSQLAREFLRRWESAGATREEEAFFAQEQWRELAERLREWVCEPVNYEVLLEDVERLETDGPQSAAARDLARHCEVLRWSSHPQLVAVADSINTHYRNANVRVAVSGELLNRLLPHAQVTSEPVNDRLLGGRIFGRSRVATRLRIVLLPDLQKWRLGLEAHGDVSSNTQTKRGPARFHSAGRSRYLVRKLLLVDRHGVHTREALGAASSRTGLTRIDTDVDGVPLVNLLVRAVAKQMYDSQADEARSAAEGLLANRAEARLDQEVNQKLSDATDKFRRAVWLPLEDLGLNPEAVNMQTTEQRLVARYRLAGHEQVGAFTPRPQAPIDSMVSIQIHESVLSNVVTSLQLGGRSMELKQMFREVAQKLHRKNFQVPEDVPEGVTIELAAHNPISFLCEEDRIHLTLRIAQLATDDGHSWNEFEVCGIYMPYVQGLKVGLERDSYIRLRGYKRRLPLRDQVALRGIFARVLASHPDIDLLASVLSEDQRLHDLRVSQFVIRDGWIGVAVGPGNPARMRIADDARQARTR